MTRYKIALATSADEPDLRRLLRENPMPGSISVSFEREPNYFTAAEVDGTLSQTLVGRNLITHDIVGMGSRIIRQMYLNGKVRDVGYISHVRVDKQLEWGLSLARQFASSTKAFRDLHKDGRTPFYLISITVGNLPARRLFTYQIPGMPYTQEYTRMFTYAISPHKRKPHLPLPRGMQMERGTWEHIPAILDCLQRNGKQHQFAPYWSIENLFDPVKTPNLEPNDFFIAVQDSRVVGCLSMWDQTPFKQTVARGYSGIYARWRKPINWLAKLIGLPNLPEVGTSIAHCYASHLAVDNNDPAVFSALLRELYCSARLSGFNYFLLGLSETNPLRKVVKKSYLPIIYLSQLYLVAWEDGIDTIKQVDGRLPGPEIAVL